MGEPVAAWGELVLICDLGVSRPKGVTAPLGGTGILMSSGDDGIIFSLIPGIMILVASLL